MGAHFDPAAIAFLKALGRNNDREWFNARKQVYETKLKAPMLEVVTEVNRAMERFAPDHVRDPAKCMMRIYRDIRFSKNKAPYKTNVAAWWARTGMEKTSGGGFYFELNPSTITIAAGVYMPEKEQTLAIRRMLLDQHATYRHMLASRSLKRYGLVEFDRLIMTRTPKGFPSDHPAEDLIRQRQWGVHATLPAETAMSGDLVKVIAARLRSAAPLVRLLNSSLPVSSPKPLF